MMQMYSDEELRGMSIKELRKAQQEVDEALYKQYLKEVAQGMHQYSEPSKSQIMNSIMFLQEQLK